MLQILAFAGAVALAVVVVGCIAAATMAVFLVNA